MEAYQRVQLGGEQTVEVDVSAELRVDATYNRGTGRVEVTATVEPDEGENVETGFIMTLRDFMEQLRVPRADLQHLLDMGYSEPGDPISPREFATHPWLQAKP